MSDAKKSSSQVAAEFVPGLAGIPAAKSTVAFIDGQVGKLQYRGYPAEVLAEHCTFEEVTYLLLNGSLPTQAELSSFDAELRGMRALKFPLVDMMKAMPVTAHPMDVLASVIAAARAFFPGDHVGDPAYRMETALRIIAMTPTAVAAWFRLRNGDTPIEPRADLGHAENFLYMLNGEAPAAIAARTMDVAFTLHAEHTMNASTFTARVVGSTLANPFAAISAAVGALSGPLHGGANEEVLNMLRAVDAESPAEIRAWAAGRLERKEKISGFGHRVYKVKDPRAGILQTLANQLFAELGSTPLFDKAHTLETQMAELVGHKGVYPNVDFYSGIVYDKLGIPADVFTPIFAIARTSGWMAHLLEQWEDNRIFRPKAVWVGESDRAFVAMKDR